MSRQEIIERERGTGPGWPSRASLPLVLYVLALAIESGSGIEIGGLETEELRSINENSSALLLATIARRSPSP